MIILRNYNFIYTKITIVTDKYGTYKYRNCRGILSELKYTQVLRVFGSLKIELLY
jgi:hypothetical protein